MFKRGRGLMAQQRPLQNFVPLPTRTKIGTQLYHGPTYERDSWILWLFDMFFVNEWRRVKSWYAWLAQSVEHETLNLRVVGSSPTSGAANCYLSSKEVLFKLWDTQALQFVNENLFINAKKWGTHPQLEQSAQSVWCGALCSTAALMETYLCSCLFVSICKIWNRMKVERWIRSEVWWFI